METLNSDAQGIPITTQGIFSQLRSFMTEHVRSYISVIVSSLLRNYMFIYDKFVSVTSIFCTITMFAVTDLQRTLNF
jgi:hypothetical protein